MVPPADAVGRPRGEHAPDWESAEPGWWWLGELAESFSVPLRYKATAGLSVAPMASGTVTKAARRAAREAAVAAQEELRKRTRANTADLATFFTAREREEAVDEWLRERQSTLVQQAAQRRNAQRRACGQALQSMRDRGEPLSEVARMAGITERTVRELIREAEQAASQDEACRPSSLAVVRSAPAALAVVGPADAAPEATAPAGAAQA